MILCADPSQAVKKHRAELNAAVLHVFDSGKYILGEEVTHFEKEFAQFVGSDWGIGVSSGTDALRLILVALGIGPGDEVITVSHTAVATVSAIVQTGATPVLVDISPENYQMDIACAAQAITSQTKAIIPVHLYGHPVDLDALMTLANEKGIPIVEDCSQAHGATWRGKPVGTFGIAAAFSCYPTKNLGALGDAGIIVTSDNTLRSKIVELREYGWRERYCSAVHGFNCRLDEMQAAILRVRLQSLHADNAIRNQIALRYKQELTSPLVTLPRIDHRADCVYHLFVIACELRDDLQNHLKQAGIFSLIHYPVPVHLQPGYARLVRCPSPLGKTEQAAKRILSLPIYPELKMEQVQQVIDSTNTFFAR